MQCVLLCSYFVLQNYALFGINGKILRNIISNQTYNKSQIPLIWNLLGIIQSAEFCRSSLSLTDFFLMDEIYY